VKQWGTAFDEERLLLVGDQMMQADGQVVDLGEDF